MRKCTLCGNQLKKDNSFCSICHSEKENIKQTILRKINEYYNSISATFFPIICLGIIYNIKNFQNFIKSEDFLILLIFAFSSISSWYHFLYQEEKIKNLQSMYKYLKIEQKKENKK